MNRTTTSCSSIRLLRAAGVRDVPAARSRLYLQAPTECCLLRRSTMPPHDAEAVASSPTRYPPYARAARRRTTHGFAPLQRPRRARVETWGQFDLAEASAKRHDLIKQIRRNGAWEPVITCRAHQVICNLKSGNLNGSGPGGRGSRQKTAPIRGTPAQEPGEPGFPEGFLVNARPARGDLHPNLAAT